MIAVYLPATHDLKGKRGPLFAGPRLAHAPEGLTNPDSITTAHGKIYVVTGMMTPHGALFVPANPEDDEHGDK